MSQVEYLAADELSDTSGTNKWTCKCSYAYQGNHSYAVKSNCSASCNCIPGMQILLWYKASRSFDWHVKWLLLLITFCRTHTHTLFHCLLIKLYLEFHVYVFLQTSTTSNTLSWKDDEKWKLHFHNSSFWKKVLFL